MGGPVIAGRSLLARLIGLILLVATGIQVDLLVRGGGNVRAQGVQSVPGTDPGMLVAYAKARAGLPEFRARVAQPQSGERFSVKLSYATKSDGIELIWANDPEFKGDQVSAVIDNEPEDIEDLKLGDRVSVPVHRVVDWMISRQGRIMKGGYTIRALIPHVTPQEAVRLRALFAPE